MEKTKRRVLFICEHNSARSQMAQEFLRHLAGNRFEAESAGLEAGTLNPLAVEAMGEIGIDLSGNRTRSLSDDALQGKSFDFVIAVCDAAAGQCPFFPGGRTLHWSFRDPSALTGMHDERLGETRIIRDEIRARIVEWLAEDAT